MRPRLLDLDEPASHDHLLVGAKAARLARARSLGLPALGGFVVPLGESRVAQERGGSILRAGGTGRARLAVMEFPLLPETTAELVGRGKEIGRSLVARSSTAHDGDPKWSGTLASFLDVSPEELTTAVRGCWASVFDPDALERARLLGIAPESLMVAVLVQPHLTPHSGGSARWVDVDTVEIEATRGSPSWLMSGWDLGVSARIGARSVVGDEALAEFGESMLRRVARLAGEVHTRLGDDFIEWAEHDDGIALLQCGPAVKSPPSVEESGTAAAQSPTAYRIVRTVNAFPGPLGEALVLPWALGPSPVPDPTPVQSGDPRRALGEARRLAGELASSVSGLSPRAALRRGGSLLAGARSFDAAALEALERLVPPDRGRAGRLLGLIDLVARNLGEAGFLDSQEEVWQYSLQGLSAMLQGREPAPPPPRSTAGPWEWFTFAVVRDQGRKQQANPAAPGKGAGLCRRVVEGAALRMGPRDVLYASRPLPKLAPLLWRAAGFVSDGGSPSAHLLGVARALHVPAVVGCPVPDSGSQLLIAVDGDAGAVFTIPL